jgi:predicted Zn-dependent peptidase
MTDTPRYDWMLYELENGLRVVVSPDKVAPVAAVHLWYDVGSRHERPGRTGFAHLFEHLMFEGSTSVEAGQHMRLVQDAGGMVNGTTSTERTNYTQTIPVEQLELLLFLEADRMAGLLDRVTQESLDKQRGIVKNERRQRYDNQPYGTAFEQAIALLYPEGHPYHHMPIGSMADLDAARLEDVHEFFRTHYTPDNAVLAVVGDVEPDAVFALAEKHFGPVPRGGPRPPAPDGALDRPVEAQRVERREAVPVPAVYLGWRGPTDDSNGADHLDVVRSALTNGYGASLYRRLVEGGLAMSVQSTLDRRAVGASLFVLTAMARPGTAAADIESVITVELARLAADGPTPVELERARSMRERDWLNSLSDVGSRADMLCHAVLHRGGPEYINTVVDRVRATTADNVRQVVADYLVAAPCVVVEYAPLAQQVAA